MKKMIKRLVIVLAALILAAVIAVMALFGREIQTIRSIRQVDEAGMLMIDVTADYGLSELVASGGVSSDSELVSFVVRHLLKGIPLQFNIPDFGCSTFQARTAEGEWLFGRNYDLNDIPGMIVRTDPQDGYASISIANISVLGYDDEHLPDSFLSGIISLAAPYVLMDGMNEMGFSIGVLLIRDVEPTHQDQGGLDMTTTAAMRWLLDQAADVDEAIAMLESMDMHASANASYHFQMADAKGNSAVVEYVDNELRVIRKQPQQQQMLTNFLISEDVYGFGTGQDRYAILQQTLEENEGILSEQQAMDLLQAVSQDKISEKTGTRSATQWSVVYNNTRKTAMIVTDRDYAHPIEIALGDER